MLNGLTLLSAVALSIPLAETALRLAWPAPSVYRALPPNLKTTFEVRFADGVQGPSRYEVNSMGVRAWEWATDRRSEYRILCMGGSTTEGLANDQSRVWTALLERKLGTMPDGRRVWVGNIGKSGWSSRHHLLQAQHLLDVYDPDWVVVLAGVNDLASRLKQGDDYDPRYTEKLENHAELVRQSFAVSPGRFPSEWAGDPWFKTTRVWLLCRLLMHRTQNPAEEDQDPEGRYLVRWRQARARGRRSSQLPPLETALNEYAHNLREIVRLVESHRAGITLMTQPVLWRADLTEEEKARLWMGGVGEFRSRPGSLYYEPAALARGLDAYNARLLEVCREAGAHCVDLAAVIPKTTQYFWDDCHFTDRGQALIAETLGSALRAPLMPRAAEAGQATSGTNR